MQENISSIFSEIENKIFTVRGLPVMLDSDLANLYRVETKYLNKVVKRNINRFPEWFMFQLTYTEWENLRFQIGTSSNEVENASRSQIVTLNEKKELKEKILRSQIATLENEEDNTSRFQIGTLNKNENLSEENLRSQIATSSVEYGGRRYLPFAFTEQGVAMLSAVLKSETAVKVSIQIMAAFVALRKLHYQSAGLYQRLELVEKKQIEADNHFNKIFSALEKRDTIPAQGIFFNGQIFDAYKFVADIIKSATTSIILIDNYIDETTLALLSKRNTGIKAIIYSEHLSRNQIIDLQKLNAQYETIEIRKLKHNHDRFLIIDEKEMYHFGASLKDLGKKIFAFSKMDNEVGLMLGRVHAGLDG